MTFREAVLSQMPAKQRAKVEAADARDRRLFWAWTEKIARRRIEKKTGQKLVGKVDWSKWLGVIMEIMPYFLKLLVLFGV